VALRMMLFGTPQEFTHRPDAGGGAVGMALGLHGAMVVRNFSHCALA